MPGKKTAASEPVAKKARTTKRATTKVKVSSSGKKKTPAKKVTTKKKPAVKKKTTKKVAKKKVTKRTVDKKKKPSHLATLTKELNKKPGTLKQKPTLPVLRNRLSLLILSPYRLPLDSERIAAQSARAVGMAFVVVGAFFSVLSAGQLSDELVLSLQSEQQVATPHPPPGSHGPDGNDGPPPIEAVTSDETEISELPALSEPPASISTHILQHTDQLKVEVEVDNADSVQIFAIVQATGEVLALGDADLSGPDQWTYRYQYAALDSGQYNIYASIENTFGLYESNRKNVFIPDALTDNDVSATGADEDSTENEEEAAMGDNEYLLQIRVAADGDLRDSVEIEVTADGVAAVELYVEAKLSSTPQFIGTPHGTDDALRLLWDTTDTPDGEYRLYAVAEANNELVRSEYQSIAIKNAQPEEETDELTESLDEVDSVDDENAKKEAVDDAKATTTEQTETVSIPHKKLSPESEEIHQKIEKLKATIDFKYIEPTPELPHTDEYTMITGTSSVAVTEIEVINTTEALIDDYNIDIDIELKHLASAVRQGDDHQVQLVKDRIKDLRTTMISNAITTGSEELIARVDGRLQSAFTTLERNVETTEEIVKDRIGEAITRDTDGDGITDFDEETIYETDPNVADSDNDGFIDGAEILNGYNPKDASPEAVMTFESPKEAGIERPDLLVVESIEKAPASDALNDSGNQAVISGQALPNSFVTLYVFSAPTIVTVRTDESGAWSYRFDKELEDGEHEVFVGVTDNAGNIVAKSAPLRFVKTANAFTPVAEAEEAGAVAVASIAPAPNLLSDDVILLILSLSIVMVGVILILLGLHLHTHRREHLVAEGYPA